MANKITNTNNYSAIASSIRNKLGVATTYTPGQMAAAIDSIPVTDIEALSVTDNGTYTAPTGTAYNPVTVNVPSSGGGEAEDGIIDRTISGAYSNRTVTKIGSYAFCDCSSLTEVSFQNAIAIQASAFINCTNLTKASFQKATEINAYAFHLCQGLIDVSVPLVMSIYPYAFYKCNHLSELTLPNVNVISGNAFNGCTRLIKLDLAQVGSVPRLSASTAFSSTPIGGYTTIAGQSGSIFVPASLYESFRAASNWSYFSSRMVSV